MAFRRPTYKRRAPKRRYTGKRTMTKKAVKAVVKTVIAREAETKTAQEYNYGANLYGPNYATFDATNIFPLGPRATTLPITQGTGQGGRIGNRVHARKLVLSGTLVPNGYNVTTNTVPQPLDVIMYVFYDKTKPCDTPTPAANGDWLQNGNGSTTFATDTLDMISPVNTDRYRVVARRKMKLGFADYSGTGSNPAAHYYANNDYKMTCNFSIDLTKYYPKVVKWNDNASATPTTRGLWLMIVPNFGSGLTMGAGQRPLAIQFMQNFLYRDA